MSTTLTVSFTASDGGVVLDGTKHFGPPSEVAKGGDFQKREPVAWVAAQEYLQNGTSAGSVTVTAA